MEKFVKHEGIVAPFLRKNVDTDTIIPIIRLVGLDLSELGRWLFEVVRYHSDGSENSEFVLNRNPYRNASILLAGENFGCGSSREGAVTALYRFGFRCVIAPSFGEIFFTNCFKNGMLAVILPEEEIQQLAAEAEADPAQGRLTVDLESCSIRTPAGRSIAFEVEETARTNLLGGLDEISATLRHEAAIAAFQERDRLKRPWIYEWEV